MHCGQTVHRSAPPNDRPFDSASGHVTYPYDPQKPVPPIHPIGQNPNILPSPPFWKSGSGIATIIVGGIVVLVLGVLILCCGLPMLTAIVSPSTTSTP